MPAQKIKFQPIQINLLPGASDFEKTTWGKILLWSLSVGRYIVVFTELVVILAFLARFKFDKDLTDLHDSIALKKAIVASSSSLEENFRNLQARISFVSAVEKSQVKHETVLSDVAKFVPIDVTITSLTLTKDSLGLTGYTLSEAGLSTLIYQFRNSDHYSDIVVDNVNKTAGSPEIQFTLSTTFLAEKL